MKKRREKRTSTKNPIEDRLVDIMDIDDPTIITLYGRPGSGKTTLSSTATKPLLIIDVKDKGGESAKSKKLQRGDITTFSLTEFDDIYKIHDYIMENPTKFKTVVIDHMTALQDLGLTKVKIDEGKDQVSQRMYGICADYLKELIIMYKDLTELGITPIFLAQDRMESGEGEGEDQLTPEVGPGLMPSVAKVLCASSRVIGHTYLQEKAEKTSDMKVHRTIEYRLRLGPNPFYITKVTKSKEVYCPPYIANATYDDIMKVISGEWSGEEKPRPRKKKR